MKHPFNYSQRFLLYVALLGLFMAAFVPTKYLVSAAAAPMVQATTCLAPNLTFARQLTLDAGAAHYFTSGDFNGDGKQDLVVQTTVGKIYTLLGDGAGNFATTSTVFLPTGGPRSQMASSDFNGDGKLDVITLSTAKLELYFNNGSGVLDITNSYAISATNFLLGDFNKDGKTDIAVTLKCCPDGVVIYLSNPSGTHTATNYAWGSARLAAVADFNGDGNLDVLTSDNYYPSHQVRLGNGQGQFTNGAYLYYDVFVFHWQTGDFNQDGKVDVVGVTGLNRVQQPATNSNKFIVLLNNGAAQFSEKYSNVDPGKFTAADFNGDGYPDIANQMTDIWVNDGTGGLCTKVSLTNSAATEVGAADFNGDGKADLIRQVNGDKLEVWLSGSGGASNTPPSITLQPTTAAQGSASTPVFGRVADTETPTSNLQLSVTGLPTGVALTNFTSVNGEVKANLTIDCSTTPGTYQIPIKVTDAGGLSATANWALTVTANQAPVLGTYANTTANASTVTIAPNRAPSDDGAIILFQVNNPVNVGAISITRDGVVTITKSTVVGSYPIIVTATDNCGLRTSTTFTFTIPTAPPPTGCDLPSFTRITTVTLSAFDELIPGDFNKDGFQDVIAIRKAVTTELPLSQVYFGDGRGGFTLIQPLSNFDNFINAGDAVKTGDFNGDGYLDLGVLRFQSVVGSGRNRYSSFQTLLNNQRGGFTGVGGSVIEGAFYDFEIGDLNNDGFADVLINIAHNNAVWLNNKNGSFTRLPNEFGSPPKVILADVNQDGKLDVINDANGYVFIWLGDGTGKFSQDRLLDTGTLRLVADLNKDGRNDIVMQRADGALQIYLYREVLILGNRVFTFALTSYPEYTSAAVASADFNGDGVLDLALADGRVVVNDGFGRFCGSADFRAQGLTSPAAAADFDGDGRADILTKDATHFYLWKSGGRVSANTPPKISIGSAMTFLPKGSNNYQVPLLATVSDAESTVNNLTLTASTSTPTIFVNEVIKYSGGEIALRLTTNFCDTALQSFTIHITATDEGGLTTTVSVPAELTDNPAPLLGQYPQNVQTPAGQTIQANPGQRPFDNGLFDLQVIQPAPGGGTASVNSDGLLTIVNTTVAGSYSVRVRVVEVGCSNVTERVMNYTVVGTAPPPSTCTAPMFAAPLHLAANNNPYGLTSGDFNGDGKIDLATTNIYDNTVTVLLAGASGYTKQAPITVGGSPNYLVARDLNGDNKLDLVVVNRGSDTVTILLGTGNGTFTKKGDYSVGNKSTGVAIGDFNGDNKLDLILPNDGLGNAVVLDGNGDGSFAAPRYLFAGNSPQPGVVADFNKDGRADVAFPNYTTGEVVILLGTGVGTFQSAIYVGNLGGSGVEGIAVGDVNGDGNLDLAVTNTTTNQVFTILGNGQGSFVNSGGFATLSAYPASLVIADFTGDGKADIAVGGYNNGQVHIFRGLGNGFESSAPLVVTVGAQPVSLVTNDFNGDGKPDLAVANNGSGTVSVLLNGCVK